MAFQVFLLKIDVEEHELFIKQHEHDADVHLLDGTVVHTLKQAQLHGQRAKRSPAPVTVTNFNPSLLPT